MKRATIQLGINFLVVLIICIVLLGIGIKLIGDFISSADKMKKDVDDYHKRQLERVMSEGTLVATYPGVVTINRGDHAGFSLSISNELGYDNNFSLRVERVDILGGVDPEVLYERGYDPPNYIFNIKIKNNEQYFTPIRITIPRNGETGTYIFDVYVYIKNVTNLLVPIRYGDIQKLHVNVR